MHACAVAMPTPRDQRPGERRTRAGAARAGGCGARQVATVSSNSSRGAGVEQRAGRAQRRGATAATHSNKSSEQHHCRRARGAACRRSTQEQRKHRSKQGRVRVHLASAMAAADSNMRLRQQIEAGERGIRRRSSPRSRMCVRGGRGKTRAVAINCGRRRCVQRNQCRWRAYGAAPPNLILGIDEVDDGDPPGHLLR